MDSNTYFIVTQIVTALLLILSEAFSLSKTPYNGIIQAILHTLQKPLAESEPKIVQNE